jgi:hypothetical protein
VAAGKGVAVDGDDQHVRQVVRRARAAHQRLEQCHRGQVEQHGGQQRGGGAALRRVLAQRQHQQRPAEPQPAVAEALDKLERAARHASATLAHLHTARRACVANRAQHQSA